MRAHANAKAGAVARPKNQLLSSSVWLVYGLMGIFLLAYVVVLTLRKPHHHSLLIDGWLVAGFEVTASALCIGRAFTWRSGRAVTLLLGAGLLSWSLGDVALTAESLGGVPPTPSLADAFYLGFYPLTYVGLMLFLRGQARRLTTPSWLDGAVAGAGAAALCAAFAFHSILHLAGGSPLRVTTDLAYPVGDVLLLGLVVGGTAMLAGRRKAPWVLMASGIALNVIGDTSNLFQSSVGASQVGHLANSVAWPASILLISVAVWLRPRAADLLAPQKLTGFALPGAAAAAGLAILLTAASFRVNRVAVGLATAALLIAGARFALSVRGLRLLTEERHRQSVTDELTGLENRRSLFHTLDAFFADLADPQMPPQRLAFLFIDLDHFKEINDSFGRPAGDEILRQVGPRLSRCLRSSDALFRLGGDEFAIVLLGADAEYAATVAQRVTAGLEEPFAINRARARLGASIGIALAPTDAIDSAGLMSCADVAMYRAKFRDHPYALYQQDIDGDGDKMLLAEELRAAVDQGTLVLHYQPLLDLRSGETRAVEALVRWPHPRLGLLPPANFLPLAENAGLMEALTALVLTRALEQCAKWWATGRQMSVSVNISPTNLLDPGFVDFVRHRLGLHGLPARALVLEVTESTVITNFERSQDVIRQLSDLGLVISIDDFGAGYTSLAHLSALEVGELKLDRTFVTDLASRDKTRELALVRATISLGHSLGLRIVAEGVEDAATLSLLHDFGCDIAQGYFIGRPQTADKLAFRPAKPDQTAKAVAVG